VKVEVINMLVVYMSGQVWNCGSMTGTAKVLREKWVQSSINICISFTGSLYDMLLINYDMEGIIKGEVLG
jgi:ABC-type long-subunit fatty acid transport system fused permease/ATPase subunit